MSEIKVIYWSQSGNTMSMANAVAEGIKEAGKEAAVLEVSAVTAADLNDETVFALGCFSCLLNSLSNCICTRMPGNGG